ncbi:MAG: hypothetical protein ACI4U6_06390, partial [Acutalibacteraceae bacterium]
EKPFHFDIHNNTVKQYTEARHDRELIPQNGVFLNLDCIHSGLGGNCGWNITVMDKYRISTGKYEFKFSILPL